MSSLLDCWYLTGPTASGKTAVGIELARLLDGEIVSLDSMALYRGMDVGTAKPTAEERAAVPHHLIDVLEPHEEYSVAQYVEAAEKCVAEIRRRGKPALFVGGTPLYLKAALRGIFEGPPADWQYRKRLGREAAERGPAWLHSQLAAVDPASAARLHPNDARRLIRALEVYQKTGRPISEWQQQFDRAHPAEACRVFVLDWPRQELHARIDRRVETMFAAGLVGEVADLLARPKPLSRTAAKAVGYREVIAHLEGEYDLATAIETVKTHTRQLAKRQMTWFRALSECRFLAVTGGIDPQRCAREIAALGPANQ